MTMEVPATVASPGPSLHECHREGDNYQCGLGIGLFVVLPVLAVIVIAVVCYCCWQIKRKRDRRRVQQNGDDHELAQPAASSEEPTEEQEEKSEDATQEYQKPVSVSDTIDWKCFLTDAGIEEDKIELYKSEFEGQIKLEEFTALNEKILDDCRVASKEDISKLIRAAKKDVAKYIISEK